jgi:hypothetical protein
VLLVGGGADVVGGVLEVGGVVAASDVGGGVEVVGGKVVGGTDELVSGGDAVVGGLVGELVSGGTLLVGDAGGSDVLGLFVLVLLDMMKARRFNRGKSLRRTAMLVTKNGAYLVQQSKGWNELPVGEVVGRKGTDWSRPELRAM